MDKVIATHRMKADDGTIYEVDEIQEYISSRPHSGGERWIPSLKRLELTDGSHVNHIDDDTFEIVSTGEIIRRA